MSPKIKRPLSLGESQPPSSSKKARKRNDDEKPRTRERKIDQASTSKEGEKIVDKKDRVLAILQKCEVTGVKSSKALLKVFNCTWNFDANVCQSLPSTYWVTLGISQADASKIVNIFTESLPISDPHAMFVSAQGIDYQAPHLDRARVLSKIDNYLSGNQFILFSTSAGSGKTSMFVLIKNKYPSIQCCYVSCNVSNSLAYFLRNESGIDLAKKTCPARSDGRRIVFIDDAQKTYWDKRNWHRLLKDQWLTANTHIQFIISATHTLRGDDESPVEFGSVKAAAGLTRKDFLLNEAEAEEFLTLPRNFGLPASCHKFSELKRIITQQCAGLVGALRMSITVLKQEFDDCDLSEMTEVDSIRRYLSTNDLGAMRRIYGDSNLRPVGLKLKEFLVKLLLSKQVVDTLPSDFDETDKQCFLNLQKAGILKEDSTEFSSPLARRYFMGKFFPRRSGGPLPKSLFDLIRESIESMSASQLAQSTVNNEDFPKEATFQHLLMLALAECTPPTCSICPELSKIFPDSDDSTPGGVIAGEVDFFLNGELRYGIELLVNGDKIREHLERFDPNKGKYSALNAKDYAVVDFRTSEDGETAHLKVQHSNRITVFFKRGGDFKRCQCLFGDQKTPVCLTLKP